MRTQHGQKLLSKLFHSTPNTSQSKSRKDFLIGISSFSLWARGLWNKNTKCLVRKSNLGQILFSFALGLSVPPSLLSPSDDEGYDCHHYLFLLAHRKDSGERLLLDSIHCSWVMQANHSELTQWKANFSWKAWFFFFFLPRIVLLSCIILKQCATMYIF